jgi:hypothetical protein
MSLSSITSAISGAASSLSSLGPQSPASQKAGDRPISFYLRDVTGSTKYTKNLSLIIRPEELTRTDVSRVTVQQTLGGGWADDFGPGLATINISGTTGWRGNSSGDGMTQFKNLKQQVFNDWHVRRNVAVKAGKDPIGVTLVLIDTLDMNLDAVIPMSFTLRRSKSRPLLMQFNIAMVSILWQAKRPIIPSSPGGLAGLLASVKSLLAGMNNVINFVKGIVNQVTAFIQTATSIFQSVTNLIAAAQSIPQSLLGAAHACAQAGMTMFSTIAALPGNTTTQSAAAMATASDFSNILCLLNNTVNTQKTYPDYTPLYGASNCSSTNGGSPPSPYANTNPFYSVVGAPQNAQAPAISSATAPVISTPTIAPPIVAITPAAQQSLAVINNSDPVLAPLSIQNLGVAAGAIATGVTLK